MQSPKFFRFKISYKKGGSFLLLPFLLFAASCFQDLSRYGKVSFHNGVVGESFVFLVDEEFLKLNPKSSQDDLNPKITKAESKLLFRLLKKKQRCFDKYRKPVFYITSRQEKVYDMTFAHLIEQNYNAKPVAPRMYFGKCYKD